MINKNVEAAINEQIKNELYSGYMYLAMSAYFDQHALPGLAHWMRLQSQEELAHALKFFDYLADRGGMVALKAIDQPPAEWDSPLAAFTAAYQHEQKVTAMIHKLYEVAGQEKDYASQSMLQWFIDEQVEEEKNAEQIVAQLKMIEAHETAILQLDHRLGKRDED